MEQSFHDELFLCSTLLDALNGCDQTLSCTVFKDQLLQSKVDIKLFCEDRCLAVPKAYDNYRATQRYS